VGVRVLGFVLFAVGFAELGDCNQRTIHPWNASTAIAAGIVYVAIGFWSLRKGWWWGPAVAVILALGFGFVLAQVLPGVPNPNYPDSCGLA
jgi:hypothetical protein